MKIIQNIAFVSNNRCTTSWSHPFYATLPYYNEVKQFVHIFLVDKEFASIFFVVAGNNVIRMYEDVGLIFPVRNIS